MRFLKISFLFMKGDVSRHIKFSRYRVVTSISLLCVWVTYKNTLDSFRIKFSPFIIVNMDKCYTPKYSRLKFVWGLYVGIEWGHDFMGLCKFRSFEGKRLIRYVAVRIASPQKNFETWFWKRKALVWFRGCPFFLSVTPFCWGVWTHEDSWIIPSFWQKQFRVMLK